MGITKRCGVHQIAFTAGLEASILGRPILSACPQCRGEILARRAEAKDRAAADDRRRQLTAACVPAGYAGRGFGSFEAVSDRQRKALQCVEAFARGFEASHRDGRCLLLCGRPGTGKTMLALAVVQALLGRCAVRYALLGELIDEVFDAFAAGADRRTSGVIRELAGLDLLVIDEIGLRGALGEREHEVLFRVLDGRYRDKRPTILASNLDAKGIEAVLGQRLFDRLREVTTVVGFDWDSYRPKVAGRAAERGAA